MTPLLPDAVWIVLIAALVGVSCSLVGVFLVLRKLSMLGDAISHSILAGIVLAFLFTGSRGPLIMLVGAGCVGLLTAYITDALHTHGRLQEDASIGVTFTWLFAVGVILISMYASQVDLDQDCVLYGEIAFTPFDTLYLFGADVGPRAFWMVLGMTVLNALFVIIGFRPLQMMAFDPVVATTLGISVTAWHYVFMALVSMTTVASFESVGAILVVAMLVVPANAAFLVAKSLAGMIWYSIAFSVLSAIGGYAIAVYFDASISAAVGVTSGLILLIILLFFGQDSLRGKVFRSPRIGEKSSAFPSAS
jgi:manganese/zinc/iron transport system permease protein